MGGISQLQILDMGGISQWQILDMGKVQGEKAMGETATGGNCMWGE